MASDPILDAVKITHQGKSTVTVDLYQVWKDAEGHPLDAFLYHFHQPGKRFWGNAKYYEEASVPFSKSEKVDTIEIACNFQKPFAELEICLVDKSSHGYLLSSSSDTEDTPVISKCFNHEVTPADAAVCYTLEVSCVPQEQTCT